MRLTNYTDYSLRVLIYLAAKDQEKLSNIKEIADVYGISKNHLMKVTYELGKMGLLNTTRGRNGGIRLALDPSDINIGAVVRKTEDDFNLVECFDPETNQCVISPVCGLKHVLNKALQSYLQILDGYTLADLVKNQRQLQEVLGTN
ncbi:Rrf2 family transcriptional regulator [Metabacillus sp. KIGAM252]|uniref:HTH-type transcriptional regulator NsrR n=1 Tax=Metabacillus flavus TaxID=2823519 RepID=A0ABS5LBT6_9BACI|nr:Rrf2 family transcriptional regulator [Metabacillus flavus]MBS2968076.1 Rrf2 family transcriptional regulator [Metabacillus flavus]